jgi:hypothetical protein
MPDIEKARPSVTSEPVVSEALFFLELHIVLQTLNCIVSLELTHLLPSSLS